jgi:pimeloyl-ACP methyl ester carboxylesterase
VPTVTTADAPAIHYHDDAGSGDPLLVIVGLANNSASAPRAWLDPLRERFRLLRVDNRGTGESSEPTQPFSIEDMAADAVAVLDATGVERAHVYGHSMGGMIAQAIGRDRPDRVRRIVFEATAPSAAAAVETTNTSPLPAAEQWRTTFMMDDEESEHDDEPAITSENAAAFYGLFLAPGFAESAEGAPIVEEMAAVYASTRGPSRRTLRWQRQAVMAFDNWPRLGEISAPALVVHPGADLVPEERAAAFANALGNGRLLVLPGVGHDVRWEASRLSTEIITEFLAGE